MKLKIKEIVKKIRSYPWSKLFWSMFPRPEDAKIRSFFELAVCVAVFIWCIKIYSDWNKVPLHTDKIDVACLAYNPPENKEWYPIADIRFSMNMSNVFKKKDESGYLSAYFSNWKISDNSDTIGATEKCVRYVKDSIALSTTRWKAIKQRNKVLSLWHQQKRYREDSIKYEQLVLKAAREGQCLWDIGTIKKEQDLLINDCFDRVSRTRNKQNPLSIYFADSGMTPSAMFYVGGASRWNIKKYRDRSTIEKCQYDIVGGDTIGAKFNKWEMKKNTFIQDFFLVKLFQSPTRFTKIRFKETPMDRPKISSPFDISQSYFNFSFKSIAIDSVILTIDFVGATDFSNMNPEPDQITMSSISFWDPVKIEQISKNGLRFHAHFKELENVQSVRLFGLAALFSALIAMFITNLILGIAKWVIKQHHI